MSTTWNPADHPREAAGKFAAKPNRAPEAELGELTEAERLDAFDKAMLEERFALLLDDHEAKAEHWNIGEDLYRRTEHAKTTTNPAILTMHAYDRVAGPALAAARNPHTPAAALHHLATTDDRAYGWEERYAAIIHPNTREETLRIALEVHKTTGFSSIIAAAVLRNDNAPADLVLAEWERYNMEAGRHPNLPREAIGKAIQDGDDDLNRLHAVSKNPALTADDLRVIAALDERVNLDDEDADNFHDDLLLVTAVKSAALHPSAPEDLVHQLAASPNAPVAKAARDRLWGMKLAARS